MKIIGLAGGSGSGKGTACRLFEKHNFATIDTDAVYHRITSYESSECMKALKAEYGLDIINSDGSLNRARLAEIVFADGSEEKRERLNKITHSYVLDEVRKQISELSKENYFGVIVDAPLLFESGFDKECNIILCIISKKNARVGRIVARDGITEEKALSRIAAQLDDGYLIAHSDYVIYNDGDENELDKKVADIANIIIKDEKGDKKHGRKELRTGNVR